MHLLALFRGNNAGALRWFQTEGTGSGSRQENLAKNLEAAGTQTLVRRFRLKCSNLARGESMKDPVGYLRIPAGFFMRAIGCGAKVSARF
jgi:hypothetical protein